MNSGTITNIGIAIVLFYSIIQILNFYGIGVNVYGSYIAFYIFLLLSVFILPKEYPTI